MPQTLRPAFLRVVIRGHMRSARPAATMNDSHVDHKRNYMLLCEWWTPFLIIYALQDGYIHGHRTRLQEAKGSYSQWDVLLRYLTPYFCSVHQSNDTIQSSWLGLAVFAASGRG